LALALAITCVTLGFICFELLLITDEWKPASIFASLGVIFAALGAKTAEPRSRSRPRLAVTASAGIALFLLAMVDRLSK
jgi:hypothetical protein